MHASCEIFRPEENTVDAPTLTMQLIGFSTIKQFQVILNRALNCAPEFGKEWFELANRIEDFYEKNIPPN